ncbi:MAG: hypothetical protein IPH98_17800 [Saprospiraceae bacterium]|nr:hypothetical protein [Candidatus Defluviibacterium haderslevense]
MTKIILVRWVIGSFGVCLCVGLCEGANPKCANAGWLKLFFKMCGGKIFKTLRWVSVGKMVWSVSSYSEIVNEFLSPENLFGSQKSGRFGVRLIVARSSFRLAYNVFEINAGRAFSITAKAKTLSQIYNIFWNEK